MSDTEKQETIEISDDSSKSSVSHKTKMKTVVISDESSSSSDSDDGSLDFYSSKFDPLKALECKALKPPADVKPCDNLAKYSRMYPRDPITDTPIFTTDSSDIKQPSTSKSADSSKQTGKRREEPEAPFERRWLPHQLPVRRERKLIKKNLITRMEKMKGPLQRLYQCTEARTKIKVWTRHDRGIRGYCIGYVTFFDKHWNMSLEDVVEVWTRPKKRKIPAALGDIDEKQQAVLSCKALKVFPNIKVIKTDKKTETCERFVDQLIIRGEQIALIVIIDEKSPSENK